MSSRLFGSGTYDTVVIYAWQLPGGNNDILVYCIIYSHATVWANFSFPPVLPHAIAVAFRKIRTSFEMNPWKEPPSDVVGQGMDTVIRYWQDAKNYGRRFSNRMKVVLVGLGSAGKTSLAIRLEGRDGDSLPREEDRTVGVEIRDLRFKPSPASHPQHSGQDLAVKLWDFAGQRAYYDTHQVSLN